MFESGFSNDKSIICKTTSYSIISFVLSSCTMGSVYKEATT